MTFPSLPPSSFQFARTALLFFWLLCGVHHGHSLEIDTPNNLTECETTELTWHGDHPPFILHILYQKDNTLVQEFNNLKNTSLWWQVNVTAGNQLYLELLDSGGNPKADSGIFTVRPGNNIACLQFSTTSSGTSTGISKSLFSRNVTDAFD